MKQHAGHCRLLDQRAAGATITPQAAAVAMLAAPIHIHSMKLHKKSQTQEDDLH